jgi:hypothetical protein
MFDGTETLIKALLILVVIFVPLGIWQLFEIIIWIFHHIHIS